MEVCKHLSNICDKPVPNVHNSTFLEMGFAYCVAHIHEQGICWTYVVNLLKVSLVVKICKNKINNYS